MAVSEARARANRKWDAENIDRISFAVPKGTLDDVKEHAAKMGETKNNFLRRAIRETMERDNNKEGE